MDRRPPAPPEASKFKAQSDVEAFRNYLGALADPSSDEEITAANESAIRVAENARGLRKGLPVGPSGEVGGIRMGELEILAEEDPSKLTPEQIEAAARRHETVREMEDRLRADIRSDRPMPAPKPMSW